MKKCSKCHQDRLETEFYPNKRRPDGLQTFCKECHNAYHRARLADPIKRAKKYEKSRLRTREIERVVAELKSRPCADCDEVFLPWQMQFDHIMSHKIDNISNMTHRGRPLQLILEEIQKCELVCANCHAHRSYSRTREEKRR